MKRSDAQGEISAFAAPDGGGADFSALFRRSFRALWLVAVGVVRDAALAEDVVQEAAIIALSKMNEFQPGTSFTAWMAKIVRYAALNKSRREKLRKSRSIDDPGLCDLAAAADRVDSSAELRLFARGELPPDQRYFDDRVVTALAGVSDVARACILLRTVAELDYSEIAGILEIPAGTAMSHVHRTRQFLRDQLADAYSRPGGAA